MKYDYLIVGAGFSGAVLASLLAKNNKVLVVDKRNHVAGNMYDYVDYKGNIIHKYGPHILTSDDDDIYSFLNRFGEWVPIRIKLQSYVDRKYVTLPINLNSINAIFNDGKEISDLLIEEYGYGSHINIIDMLSSENMVIKEAAFGIYNKVFLGYNAKMWGMSPMEIDKSVVGRSPIRITYEDRKFNTKYEIVPRNGYTRLFERMLKHDNIDIKLKTNACDLISIVGDRLVSSNSDSYKRVIFTGNIDELFNYKYGKLPYRALRFKVERKKKSVFKAASVTYPQNYKKTRTTEMRKITGQIERKDVVLVSEYPGDYDYNSQHYSCPSYPVLNNFSLEKYNRYKLLVNRINNLFTIGRLAEFQYINMDETIRNSMKLYHYLEDESTDGCF